MNADDPAQDQPYNAANTTASNLGPTSQKLIDSVSDRAKAYREENGLADGAPVPVDAVTASGSIGYAAYYAATREFPHRYITLRHKNRVVSRWNAPQH